MKDAEEEKMEEKSTVDKDSNLDKMMEVDKVMQKPVDKSLIQLTGRVVGIIKRNWRPYCATCTFATDSRWITAARLHANTHSSQPIDGSPMSALKRDKPAFSLMGKRIIVNIDSWPPSSRFPQGHFVKELETKKLKTRYS